MTSTPDELTVGPLTATEWCSFFLIDGHPREDENPLPACCPDISQARDAILAALRGGGGPDVCWINICLVWPIIKSHLATSIHDEATPLALRKLYYAYVEGRNLGTYDEAEGKARIMERGSDLVRQVLAAVPGHYDLDTVKGRMQAVARVGGAFVAYVYDRAERTALIRELAAVVGMAYEDVAMMVDVMRLGEGLPWAPAEGARVP